MSALPSVHGANAQAIAQIQRLTEIAAQGQLALVDHAVKVAELAQTQVVQAASESSTEAALDTVV